MCVSLTATSTAGPKVRCDWQAVHRWMNPGLQCTLSQAGTHNVLQINPVHCTLDGTLPSMAGNAVYGQHGCITCCAWVLQEQGTGTHSSLDATLPSMAGTAASAQPTQQQSLQLPLSPPGSGLSLSVPKEANRSTFGMGSSTGRSPFPHADAL